MTIEIPEAAHVMRQEIGVPGEAVFVLLVHGDLASVSLRRKAVKEALDSLKARLEPSPCMGCGDAS